MKTHSSSISRREFSSMAVWASLAMASSPTTQSGQQKTISDWTRWPLPGCRVSLGSAEVGKDGWLVFRAQSGPGPAALQLAPEDGVWDVESYAEIAVPVRNLGKENIRVVLRLDDGGDRPLPADKQRRAEFVAVVPPDGEPFWLVVFLGDRRRSPLAGKFVAMLAPPPEFVRRGRVDGAHLRSIEILLPDALAGGAIAIGPVVAQGVPVPLRAMPASQAFPLIDEYGQFIHREWKNKVHGPADLRKHRQAEETDLAAHRRPATWNRFGGWAEGPRREATGFFRAEKYDGCWWMVDPEGRLYWSHGVVRVGTRIRVGTVYLGTPLPDREHYFRLPPKDSELGVFYGTEPQSTRGYYFGKDNHAVYDFLEANLFRKYGAGWRNAYATQAQRRLASWGLNSIANSSDPTIYLQRQTPYTAIVYSAPLGRSEHRIEASGGAWGKLPDPFDPGWRQLMDRTLQTELKESIGDPWCLGFFVDNELNWGEPHHLAQVVLSSPARQPAKKAFLSSLRAKYGDVQALNRAWEQSFATWERFLDSTTPPSLSIPSVRADLEAFSEQVADAYFRGCRDAVKAVSPNHLYLGARFAGLSNPLVMRIAARHCDVVSINRYSHTVTDLALPGGVDRPIVIGEFHFGAVDAPTFATANGLGWCANQFDRARAYRVYVESALRHPAIVGTHWFQYYDQPITGRFDGENFNAGLLDICDTPYVETIAACRQIGLSMYATRMH